MIAAISDIKGHTELITLETFAERMGISRATAFEWVRRQVLVQGRHYIKFGRVVRVCWDADLIQKLLQDCAVESPPTPRHTRETKDTVTGNRSLINWDYK